MEKFQKHFSLKSFSFPLESNNISYHKSLKYRFTLFEKKINELESDTKINQVLKSEIENIKKSNTIILQVISEYLSGNSGKAYKTIEDLLEGHYFKSKITSLIDNDYSNAEENLKLIRLRNSERQLFSREEMFHVPFSKRHLVSNQRFSIAGLPCLYLGSSIYVCWLELKRKSFDKLWISAFNTQEKFKVLNLAYDINILFDQLENGIIDEKQFINYFLLWPLVMASSFKTKYPDASFHEEYIIPSLLLQWITFKNKNISSLKYLSTKLSNYENHEKGINYVFPPQFDSDNFDFCKKLKLQFKLSKPIPWSLVSLLSDSNYILGGYSFDDIEEAILEGYKTTKFFYIEEKIFQTKMDFIQNPKKNK